MFFYLYFAKYLKYLHMLLKTISHLLKKKKYFLKDSTYIIPNGSTDYMNPFPQNIVKHHISN